MMSTSDKIKNYDKNNRVYILDTLRGISIIYVVIYHLLYDMINFKGMNIFELDSGISQWIHYFFLAILIGVSGICTAFSRNVFKRGAILFLIGEVITIGTALFSPSNIILFGILSFMGIMMLLYGLIQPYISKIPPIIMFTVWILLFIAFKDFETENGLIHLFVKDVTLKLPLDNHYLYPIGITHNSFFSADYYPIIPTGFVFLAGTALSEPIADGKFPAWFYKVNIPALSFLGRHSLIIYLVHQPLFLLLFTFI